MTRRTVHASVNRLVEWYKSNPSAPRPTEIRVRATRRTIMKFARPKERGGPLLYEGFVIVPLKRSVHEPVQASIQT